MRDRALRDPPKKQLFSNFRLLNDVDARERCVGASSKMNSLRALLGGTPPVVAHSKRTRVRGTRPKGPRQEAPLGQPQGGSPHHHGRHGCVGDPQSRVVPASKDCINDRDRTGGLRQAHTHMRQYAHMR